MSECTEVFCALLVVSLRRTSEWILSMRKAIVCACVRGCHEGLFCSDCSMHVTPLYTYCSTSYSNTGGLLVNSLPVWTTTQCSGLRGLLCLRNNTKCIMTTQADSLRNKTVEVNCNASLNEEYQQSNEQTLWKPTSRNCYTNYTCQQQDNVIVSVDKKWLNSKLD